MEYLEERLLRVLQIYLLTQVGLIKQRPGSLGVIGLETGNRKGGYRTFEMPGLFVRRLELKGQSEWKQWVKSSAKPADIPANPAEVYRNKGWVSFGDWLGTECLGLVTAPYRSFDEARKFVHGLGLKNRAEWSAWAKTDGKPEDIPANPRGTVQRSKDG